MSTAADRYSTTGATAAKLRLEFDQSFASPPATTREELATVLALTIEGNRFAVRSSQIAGIAKCGKIVAVPARSRALLGLAGIRGELLPVYSLHELLGCARAGNSRWLLLCDAPVRIALAFEEFQGCFKVASGAFSAGADAARSIVAINGEAHTLIEISMLARDITHSQEEI